MGDALARFGRVGPHAAVLLVDGWNDDVDGRLERCGWENDGDDQYDDRRCGRSSRAMCGAGKSCHLASCGPPAQYACFTAGAASAGAACMSSSDCSAGLTCIRYSLTVSVCEKQCTLDRDCTSGRCAGFTTCSNAVMGRFCLRACSDVTAAGAAACGTGFKCDGACVGQTSTPVCIAAGTARSGPCMSSADCAAGYTCINRSLDGGVAGECMQLCRTAADCTAGMCTGNIACAGVASGSHFCL